MTHTHSISLPHTTRSDSGKRQVVMTLYFKSDVWNGHIFRTSYLKMTAPGDNLPSYSESPKNKEKKPLGELRLSNGGRFPWPLILRLSKKKGLNYSYVLTWLVNFPNH